MPIIRAFLSLKILMLLLVNARIFVRTKLAKGVLNV